MIKMACRSCGRQIYMLRNEKTGRFMPIESQPDEEGNITIDVPARTFRILKGRENVEFDGPRYVSHFATCRQAQTWRS